MSNKKSKKKQTPNAFPIQGITFKFFFVSEVAAMMRVSSATIYKLIHEGKIQAIKIGRVWKISEAAVSVESVPV